MYLEVNFETRIHAGKLYIQAMEMHKVFFHHILPLKKTVQGQSLEPQFYYFYLIS